MKKCLTALFAGLVLIVTTAYAGCVDTFGIGSKATAMGGAYSAYADDPFAVYYNPAGLTQITSPTLAMGVHVIEPDLEAKGLRIEGTQDPSFQGRSFTVSDDFPTLAAPHIGFAMPLTDRIALGVAAYAPWGLEVEWPNDPAKNPGVHSSYHSYYKRITVTPTLAYKINEHVSLGFGVSIGRSEAGGKKIPYYFSNSSIPVAQGTLANLEALKAANIITPQQEAARIRLDNALKMHGQVLELELSDDLNYSFNFGIMYKPMDTITLGLTYRSETSTDFDGDLKRNGVKIGKATMDYNHPQQIQAGIRYAPHDRFSMEFDLVWTEWSINKRQVEHITPHTGAPFDLAYDRNWDNTRQIRFGAEYVLSELITLRCGYFYDPSPIPDDTLDLMWPDADKKTYSIGAGFHFGNFTLDTVLQYTAVEQDRIVGGESDNFNKSYIDVIEQNDPRVFAKAGGHLLGAGLTLSYRF
ncbi:outer membrane protein transport protein [Desulfobotulus sp. H1]|uniref:Outer membrane protein transport protein n=1 Tax=Desulfobotulus pelophilus TaxID=2823377 RepID=A0ABT3N9H2_9BACT|nr:outer membrane protein transport protein [Desulfobotulus pelophilus]